MAGSQESGEFLEFIEFIGFVELGLVASLESGVWSRERAARAVDCRNFEGYNRNQYEYE